MYVSLSVYNNLYLIIPSLCVSLSLCLTLCVCAIDQTQDPIHASLSGYEDPNIK